MIAHSPAGVSLFPPALLAASLDTGVAGLGEELLNLTRFLCVSCSTETRQPQTDNERHAFAAISFFLRSRGPNGGGKWFELEVTEMRCLYVLMQGIPFLLDRGLVFALCDFA